MFHLGISISTNVKNNAQINTSVEDIVVNKEEVDLSNVEYLSYFGSKAALARKSSSSSTSTQPYTSSSESEESCNLTKPKGTQLEI